MPSLHLVSCSQTVAKAVRLRETILHHCSAHSSKIDKTFDCEDHVVLRTDTVSATRVACSHMTNCLTNINGKWVSRYQTNGQHLSRAVNYTCKYSTIGDDLQECNFMSSKIMLQCNSRVSNDFTGPIATAFGNRGLYP